MKIALIAHDRKKDLMVKLVTAYRFILEKQMEWEDSLYEIK